MPYKLKSLFYAADKFCDDLFVLTSHKLRRYHVNRDFNRACSHAHRIVERLHANKIIDQHDEGQDVNQDEYEAAVEFLALHEKEKELFHAIIEDNPHIADYAIYMLKGAKDGPELGLEARLFFQKEIISLENKRDQVINNNMFQKYFERVI